MERLIDKLVVGIGCAIVVATEGPDVYAVVGVLCGVVASGLFEWLPRRRRTLAPDVFLVASLFWPQLLAMVPLMAYDAARWGEDGIENRGGSGSGTWTGGWSGSWNGSGHRSDRSAIPGIVMAVLCLAALFAAALTLPLLSVLLVWLFAGLAVVLSLRTTRTIERERRQRVMQDDLRGRGIALEARNRDLRDRQDYEVDIATMAERGRIARDIHDNVGHLLTRASLQVEALRVAYEGDPSLDRSLDAVKGTVDEALASVRASVHEMYDGTFDLVDRLRAVIGQFEEQSSMKVNLVCDFDDVPTNVGLAFLAVVKEALSNAARHSGAEGVDVKVVEYPGLYQLSVEDDGRGIGTGIEAGNRTRADRRDDIVMQKGAVQNADSLSSGRAIESPEIISGITSGSGSVMGMGMGLAAMEERIVALGGHFVTGPRPDGNGWRVFCSVPMTTVSRETYVRPNERHLS